MANFDYQEKDIFGMPCNLKVKREDTYDAFVEKFERKKTTDDCYTPECVYEAVLEWLCENGVDVDAREIVRPFYPDKDYKVEAYPEGCIVVDNPPFSIITEICRWYLERGIMFFLFAPHLTLFSGGLDITHVVSGSDITYHNGTKIKTSFLSNLFGGLRILSAPSLYRRIKEAQERSAPSLPRYRYPDNVVMVSDVGQYAQRGIPFQLHKDETQFVRGLDAQRAMRKAMFGGGFLCSDKAAADKAAADKAAADKAAKKEVIEWKLSEREKEIIKGLG